ncbi:protein Loquacious-like [Anticarsia gemmatalis]|uniref:protein Loquacious-like n=1 Tax=Anticarsia gemmatalis TaxID=129554 RepID=UPI003F766A40
MKTAVTVLQEMMVKEGYMPQYECISQTGPQHQSLFEYRCMVLGEVAQAAARSKKEAKQEVARVMLQKLSAKGHSVPSPYGCVPMATSSMLEDEITPSSPADTRSYVALLKELCEEYRLTAVEYELVGDTGPPHLRHFTVRARIGKHERLATSTTKKNARQLAAEQLYTYLRANLARVTKDFDEQDALMRAHEKAMERYQEPNEEIQRRPDLGQQVANYHLGLVARLDKEVHERVVSLLNLEREREPHSPERVLGEVAKMLRIDMEFSELERREGTPLSVLELSGCAPELAFAATNRPAAARTALGYVRLAFDTQIDPEPYTDPALGLKSKCSSQPVSD